MKISVLFLFQPVFELGDGEFFSDNEAFVQLAKVFCHSSIDELCANALFVICGFNEKNINAVSI